MRAIFSRIPAHRRVCSPPSSPHSSFSINPPFLNATQPPTTRIANTATSRPGQYISALSSSRLFPTSASICIIVKQGLNESTGGVSGTSPQVASEATTAAPQQPEQVAHRRRPPAYPHISLQYALSLFLCVCVGGGGSCSSSGPFITPLRPLKPGPPPYSLYFPRPSPPRSLSCVVYLRMTPHWCGSHCSTSTGACPFYRRKSLPDGRAQYSATLSAAHDLRCPSPVSASSTSRTIASTASPPSTSFIIHQPLHDSDDAPRDPPLGGENVQRSTPAAMRSSRVSVPCIAPKAAAAAALSHRSPSRCRNSRTSLPCGPMGVGRPVHDGHDLAGVRPHPPQQRVCLSQVRKARSAEPRCRLPSSAPPGFLRYAREALGTPALAASVRAYTGRGRSPRCDADPMPHQPVP
ncbi:hypothetical protein BC628DRAFT_1149713 [Trametes gibbosa]|nr:hypothetical protein BC628DRAFT_1149713 [Trametes gibbosa]